MSHHEKDGADHDAHAKDGSTDHPDTEVTAEDGEKVATLRSTIVSRGTAAPREPKEA